MATLVLKRQQHDALLLLPDDCAMFTYQCELCQRPLVPSSREPDGKLMAK
jgi:hypothetical protein